jgi:hypothetical protein
LKSNGAQKFQQEEMNKNNSPLSEFNLSDEEYEKLLRNLWKENKGTIGYKILICFTITLSFILAIELVGALISLLVK